MNSFLQALAAILGGAVFAALGFYYFEFEPFNARLEEIKSEKTRNQQQLDQRGTIEDDLAKLDADIAQKETERKNLIKGSPNMENQVPDLLKSLENTAQKFEMQFSDIRISPLIRNEQWSELPVEFTLRGTFHSLGKFLFDYENKKIINLTKGTLSIAPTSEMDPKSKKPKVTVQLSGTIYVLNSGGTQF